MDRTFDNLRDAIRSGYEQPGIVAGSAGFIFGKFITGIAIGCGIAVGLAITRAGVGL